MTMEEEYSDVRKYPSLTSIGYDVNMLKECYPAIPIRIIRITTKESIDEVDI
jgi:hypothetical protein